MIQSCSCLLVLTILGLARAVVRLGQVALHTGAGVGAFGVSTGLTAGPVHSALIKICTTKTTEGLNTQFKWKKPHQISVQKAQTEDKNKLCNHLLICCTKPPLYCEVCEHCSSVPVSPLQLKWLLLRFQCFSTGFCEICPTLPRPLNYPLSALHVVQFLENLSKHWRSSGCSNSHWTGRHVSLRF